MVGEWKGFSFVSRAFVAFRGRSAVPAVPGVGGGSASIRRCWDFCIFGNVGFSNVRMLVDCDFECFCFGLDDFANLENCKINLSESL